MKKEYEWDIETMDDHGDILDHCHAGSLSDFNEELLEKSLNDPNYCLVLIRDIACSKRGVLDRVWAYVKDGELPEFFSTTRYETEIRVPKRFHEEIGKMKNCAEIG